MRLIKILPLRPAAGGFFATRARHGVTGLALALGLLAPLAACAQPVNTNDGVILDMQAAHRRGDRAALSSLLPAAQGHALEAWAAYWELNARLKDATPDEVQGFLRRWAGSYQEDRLRNDWLLLLGERRDAAGFAALYPGFRMRDDRHVRCYARAFGVPVPENDPVAGLLADWNTPARSGDDACALAAARYAASGALPASALWAQARLALDAGRIGAARSAAELATPGSGDTVRELNANPQRFLASRGGGADALTQELTALALVKLATSNPDAAAAQMDGAGATLTPAQRNWVWGALGRRAALNLSGAAALYYRNVTRAADLDAEQLEWMARAGLRQGDWAMVQNAIAAMPLTLQQQSVWQYWLGRTLAATGGPAGRAQAAALWQRMARPGGDFYEKLAVEESGRSLVAPSSPAQPPTPTERDAALRNPALARALYAIGIGLRSEGVREWNYATNLHTPGGMSDRELYAAATLACERQLWDRCINTSERIKGFTDLGQRFPMPFREQVIGHARAIGLDPAYVYGLIRQESRFITHARSGVGASGLMQVMPATARWTARRIGLTGFRAEQINEVDTNILIGTHYLKLALDDFDGSMPLAAAAYNAGPGRPRAWRNGPTLEGAIWAENVPFAETRDYVKKVLTNTVDYAGLITGQPQSLKARLGRVAPLGAGQIDPSSELP